MTSPATQITDHAERALETLLSQFSRSPHIRALTEIIGDEIQALEDWMYLQYAAMILDTAVGVQLDQLGAKVGSVTRLGRTDAEFRRIIEVVIAAKQSDGGADQIIDIATRLFGATAQYIKEGTARFRLDYESSETLEQQFLDEAIRILGFAIPGGVQWIVQAVDSQADEGARFGRDTFGDARFGTIIGGEGY